MSVTMRQMLEAGVHFGHQTRYWNPKMAEYIFGDRNKIHIVNLEKTLPMFEDALKYVRQLAANKGRILFVGTKRQARDIVREEAERAGCAYVNLRWLGGMLTNFQTVRKSIKRMQNIDKMATDGTFERINKKERLMLDREKAKLQMILGGIEDMTKLPGAIFMIDVKREHIAVSEATRLGIPTIALVDTNSDPTVVDYAIPGNDDASKSIYLIVREIADSIIEGSQERKREKSEEETAPAAEVSEVAAELGVDLDALKAVEPKPVTPAPTAPTNIPKPPAPRPGGNNPFGAPRPPQRPAGNNPFGTGSIPRPPARPNRPIRPGEQPRPGFAARPGQQRPGFAARPGQGGQGGQRPGFAARPGQGGQGGQGRPQSGAPSPYKSGGALGAPGGTPFGKGKGGRPGPGGRGNTAGAFGKGGSKKSNKQKSKKALRDDFENMQAPVLGGVKRSEERRVGKECRSRWSPYH